MYILYYSGGNTYACMLMFGVWASSTYSQLRDLNIVLSGNTTTYNKIEILSMKRTREIP